MQDLCFTRCSIIILLLLHSVFLFADHDTLTICRGESVQLAIDPSFATYRWEPVSGLDNPTIHTPVAAPPVTTTYIVETIPAAGENLIINGDFSAGNTGFTSNYVYSPGANPTQGVYGVFDDANDLSPSYFEHCRDHTNQNGLMMVVDGSPVANLSVWCQTINIESNTTYAFSTWLTSILQPNPAALRFSINGQQIGQTFVASTQNCEWRQFYEIWESGGATQAEICIVNQNTNPNGNDFALDDFGFFEIGAPAYDTFTIVVHDIPVTSIETTFCEGEQIEYQGQMIPVSESFELTYTSQFGCDSIVRYSAELVDTVTIVNRIDTLCPGETFSFQGHLIDRDTLICTNISAANGCDTTYCLEAVYLTESALNTDVLSPACSGSSDGAIMLSVEAGLAPFQYRWEDGSTEANRVGLAAGNYQIAVTDAKGCRALKTVSVTEPAPLSAEVSTSSSFCNGTTNGVIEMSASGGTPPYRYSIDGGRTYGTESLVSGLMPGDYEVWIEDANQCVFSVTATVPQPRRITLNVPLSGQIGLGESLSINITDNASGPLSYEWIPADGVACPTCANTEVRPLRSTLYTIRATDEFGCSVEAFFQVDVSKDEAVYIPNAFSPNEDGVNDQFRLFTGLGVEEILDFSIYDRWGNLLYYRASCASDCSWDGRLNGRVLGQDVYVFMARLRYLDGEVVPLSGEVNLLW
ncbi:T9SS type B sorting domain-containing protein [Flavilitoribacter nigricans]|uniref:T9SS type B sorting domain-containing protein n=1 Tax=Flavilitoribacter nigricans (strain ATCC 23147 / DSM 23189 / NBRC 102662 / NCIMB 1420 / SS-2) TaxID=1122177 RepID=A0A2D0N4J6_FLAN2|nr:T9SS type B sorting domain-containing protein [Flavilitoribacter nigricans]PHN03472.1 hypothetical protein CRP01_26070 [Flavilitoribacter nigricans DSM 23189 = NBRC 102662]